MTSIPRDEVRRGCRALQDSRRNKRRSMTSERRFPNGSCMAAPRRVVLGPHIADGRTREVRHCCCWWCAFSFSNPTAATTSFTSTSQSSFSSSSTCSTSSRTCRWGVAAWGIPRHSTRGTRLWRSSPRRSRARVSRLNIVKAELAAEAGHRTLHAHHSDRGIAAGDTGRRGDGIAMLRCKNRRCKLAQLCILRTKCGSAWDSLKGGG